MKITGNEVEVVKHQSVIALLLLFLFAAVGCVLLFHHQRLETCLDQEDMG